MKKFIFSIVAALVLCIGVFAIPKTDSPANKSASVSVAKTTPATAVSIDNLATFNFEVAAIPTDLATAAINLNQTSRTATDLRSNPSTAIATDTSPPSSFADLSFEAFEHPDYKVPLGSPKPVEATARNGSQFN